MSQIGSPGLRERAGASREQNGLTMTDDEFCVMASEAQLPLIIKSDINTWIAVGQTIAVTSSIFAAVQISLNAIIEAEVFGSDNPQPGGHAIKTWRYLRWFLYATVVTNLACAGSSIAVINLVTSLECEFGRFAVLYHEGDEKALRRYKDAYEWVLTGKLPSRYVKEKFTYRRLKWFGIDNAFPWISYGMALSFVTGVLFAFISFLYWIILTQGSAAVGFMAVIVAIGIVLTLSFLFH